MSNKVTATAELLAVTSLELRCFASADGHPMVVSSHGRTARICSLADGRICWKGALLKRNSVHGMVFRDTVAQEKEMKDIFVAFGHREVRVFEVRGTLTGIEVCFICEIQGIEDFIWDARWLARNRIAFVSAQGFVEIWEQEQHNFKLVSRILSQARCMNYSASFAKSGEHALLASGSVFGEIYIWDGEAQSGGFLEKLDGHHGPVFRVKWHPESNEKLCSVGDDRTVRFWKKSSAQRFEMIWRDFRHEARVWDCEFLPLNEALVSVGEDRKIIFWRERDGAILAIADGHFGRNIWRCAVLVHPVSQTHIVATGGGDSNIHIWDAQREIVSRIVYRHVFRRGYFGERVAKRSRKTAPHIKVVHLLQDGSAVLILTSQGSIYHVKNPLKAVTEAVEWSLAWENVPDEPESSPRCIFEGSGLLLVGTHHGAVDVYAWESSTRLVRGKRIANHVAQHPGAISCLELSSKGERLISSCRGFVHFWDFDKESFEAIYDGSWECSVVKVEVFTSLALDEERNMLIMGDSRGSMHLMDLDTRQSTSIRNAHGRMKVSALVLHKGDLYSGGFNGEILQCKVRKYPLLLEVVLAIPLTSIMDNVTHLKWTQEEQCLLIGGFQFQDFLVWNLNERHLLLRERVGSSRRPFAALLPEKSSCEDCVMFFAENPDQRGEDGLALVRVGRASSIVNFPTSLGLSFHSRNVWTVQWLPDPHSDILFTGCEDGLISLVEFNDANKEFSLTKQVMREHSVRCSHIMQNRTVIVTGGSSQMIRAWSLKMDNPLELLAELELHDGIGSEGPGIVPHRVFGLHAFGDIVFAGTTTGRIHMLRLVVDDIFTSSTVTKNCARGGKAGRLEGIVPLKGKFSQVKVLCENDAPVRCLVGHEENERFWIVAGRTNGTMEIYHGLRQDVENTWRKICRLEVHQMGVNCVCTSRLGNGSAPRLLVASGGDDQAIALFMIDLNSASVCSSIHVVTDADASAVRGIKTEGDVIWSAGLNQRLQVWKVNPEKFSMENGNITTPKRIEFSIRNNKSEDDAPLSLVEGTETLVDVPAVNALSVRSRDATTAIVGTGMQVLRF